MIPATPDGAPRVDLRHVVALTDDTGILQHGFHGVGDPHHGYCTDDNARALIAMVEAQRLGLAPDGTVHARRYLAFLRGAFDPAAGVMRNFLAWDRRWRESAGSEDSQARALWALAVAATRATDAALAESAAALLDAAGPIAGAVTAPRARAFAMLALAERGEISRGRTCELLRMHADELAAQYDRTAGSGWAWFEDVVTYDNARLPQAMLLAGRQLDEPRYREIGLTSLRFLLDAQRGPGGVLKLIGNRGWLRRGEPPAEFDEQPLEPAALVEACLLAEQVTGDPAWRREAGRCFAWYHGENVLGIPLYDRATGGCFDGLEPGGVNRNRGAEAALSFALAGLALEAAERESTR